MLELRNDDERPLRHLRQLAEIRVGVAERLARGAQRRRGCLALELVDAGRELLERLAGSRGGNAHLAPFYGTLSWFQGDGSGPPLSSIGPLDEVAGDGEAGSRPEV